MYYWHWMISAFSLSLSINTRMVHVVTRSSARLAGLAASKNSALSSNATQAIKEISTTQKPAALKRKATEPKAATKQLARKKVTTTKSTPSKLMSKIRTVDQDYVHNPSTPLLELPDDIVIGEIVCRPSKRNKSPYVADVLLMDENRQAIVHVPNLDMGGKSIPGAKLLVKPARDPKGNLVGPNAVNPKYGTPKCEFHAQLLRVEEDGYEPTWVGAHPNLGERITEQLIERHLLCPELPKVASYEREVRNICGTNMRADFVVKFVNPQIRPRIVEVKTVVDTDYEPSKIPPNLKCRFVNTKIPYKRTAIFPWGSSNQKGPDGEKVVSARAIKHVQELTQIAQGKLHDGQQYDATVLFIIIRNDAKAFRPNHEACPSFSKYLKQAQQAGVQILAKQVQWGEGDDIGKCMEGPLLDIEWPDV